MLGLRRAIAFLTRVKIHAPVDGASDLASAVPWFPVVGGFVGLAVAGCYAGLVQATTPLVAAVLALGLGTLLTGAFHEDGFGDTTDGFGGGHTRADVLRIMKDPRQGTYGVMAIVISFTARTAAIAALPWKTALVVLPAVHAVSRASAILLMRALPAATEDGLGSAYLASLTTTHVITGITVGTGIAVVLLGAWGGIAAGIGVVAALGVGWLAHRKIAGITGDVLGACQQVTEIAGLALMAGVTSKGWPAWGMLTR